MEDRNFRRRLISSSQDPIHLPTGFKRLEYLEGKSMRDWSWSLNTEAQPFTFTSKGYGPDFEIKIGHAKDKNMYRDDSTNYSKFSLDIIRGGSNYFLDEIRIKNNDFTDASYMHIAGDNFKLNYDKNNATIIKYQNDKILINNNEVFINDSYSVLNRKVVNDAVGIISDHFKLRGAFYPSLRFYYCCYTDGNGKKYYIVPAYNTKNEWLYNRKYYHICLYDTHGVIVLKNLDGNCDDSYFNYKFVN